MAELGPRHPLTAVGTDELPVDSAGISAERLAMRPSGDPRTADARMRHIIEEHYPFLWRSLRRLGVPDAQLEDAAQQVLLVMARRLPEIHPAAERSFLFGAAVRVAADARRTLRRRREEPMAGDEEGPATSSPTPEDLASVRSDRRLLSMALESLSLEHRSVFVLFELEELPMSEIATLLRLPPGTVASRLRRARELFKEAIEHLAYGGRSSEESPRGRDQKFESRQRKKP